MFKVNKAIVALVAVPMATLVAVGLTAGPAAADPPPPTGAVYCGVGSDTTQDVVQKLASTLTSTTGKKFESWNATPKGSTITTSCAAGSFARPDGSGAGRTALRDSLGLITGPVPAGAVTFARSSSLGTLNPTGPLQYIPFALDAVAPAAKSGGAIDTATSGNLTLAQVKAIYQCTLTTLGGKTIQPYVPQSGSGTRSFWLGVVGITEAQVNTTCVKDTKVGTGATIQEHDGTVLTDPTVSGVNYTEIVPISIAQNIAQTNHVATGVTDRRGSSKLLKVDGIDPKDATGKINTAFEATMQRKVYNVFSWNATVNTVTRDAQLVSLFVGGSSKVCGATSTITLFGFRSISDCGATPTSLRADS